MHNSSHYNAAILCSRSKTTACVIHKVSMQQQTAVIVDRKFELQACVVRIFRLPCLVKNLAIKSWKINCWIFKKRSKSVATCQKILVGNFYYKVAETFAEEKLDF